MILLGEALEAGESTIVLVFVLDSCRSLTHESITFAGRETPEGPGVQSTLSAARHVFCREPKIRADSLRLRLAEQPLCECSNSELLKTPGPFRAIEVNRFVSPPAPGAHFREQGTRMRLGDDLEIGGAVNPCLHAETVFLFEYRQLTEIQMSSP